MTEHVMAAIVAAAVVTALIRAVPVIFLAHRSFPVILRNWLSFIPTAILTAIIAAEVLGKNDFTSSGISVALLATVVSLIAGLVSRSLFVSVIASILAYLLFQNI